jgi:fumarate reductase flavoprotein subunit
MIVGEYIADFCDKRENDASIPTGVVNDFVAREKARLQGLILGRGREDASAIKARMQAIMTAKVGIFRTGKDLEEAVDELQKLVVRSRSIGLRSSTLGANPELVTAYRVQRC